MNDAKFWKKYSNIIISILIGIFLLTTLYSVDKPFVLDELSSFVTTADNINKVGMPVTYYGEQDKEVLGVFHPTLYLYLLALSFRIFGVSEFSARLPSIFFSLLTILLIPKIIDVIYSDEVKRSKVKVLTVLIYIISPFVIQNSLLIDIDGSVLIFLMTLFTYLFLKRFPLRKAIDLVLLGVLLSIVFWAKLPGGVVLIVSTMAFYFINKKTFEGFLKTFTISAIGSVLFIVSWWIYCKALNLPFAGPFIHNFNGLMGSGLSVSKIFLIAWCVKNIIFWIGPPFFILLSIAFFKRIKEYIKERKVGYLDFLFLYGLIISLLYLSNTAYGFPKYNAPMMVPFSIIIGSLVADFDLKLRKNLIAYFLLGIFILGFMIIVVKDPFIQHNIFYTQSVTFENDSMVYLLSNLNGLLYILPVLISFLVLFALKKPIYPAIIISCILTLFFSSIYIDFVQAKADYFTSYAYGQEGLLEAANYIKTHVKSDEMIFSRHEIAYYANQSRFYRTYPAGPETLNDFDQIIANKNISYIVTSPSEKLPDFSYLFDLEEEFGHFKIYKRK